MRCSALLIMACMFFSLLIAVAAPVAAANLLANGDFERPNDQGGAAYWFTRGETNTAEAKLVAGGYQSSHCLMLEGHAEAILFGVYSLPVDIDDRPGERMLLTCYYRTYSQPQAYISLVTFREDFQQLQWQTPPVQIEAQPIAPSNNWSLLSWQFEPVVGARQVVVVVRIRGEGRLYLDKLALRPYPDDLSAQIQAAGILYELPHKRRADLQLTNRSDRERQIQVEAIAIDERGRGTRAHRQATIAAQGQGLLSLPYRFALDKPHTLQIILTDRDSGEIYEHQQVDVPGLLKAHFRRPAFRGTVLSSIPTPYLEIVGRINATQSLARRTKLSAQIADFGLVATEDNGAIDRPAPDSFVIQFPTENMISGDYVVSLRAKVEGSRLEHELRLPLRVLAPSSSEVGYDTDNRLWVGGQPVLPRGLYNVMDPQDLERIAAAGFNFVLTPAQRASYALAEKANELGLTLVISTPVLSSNEDNILGPDRWDTLQDKFGADPALLGWSVLSRPDQKAVAPEIMARLYDRLCQDSPRHPVLLTLSSPSLLKFYTDSTDIVVAWSLPVPDCPLTAVAQVIQAAQQAVGGRKPVWAAIQATGPGWYQDVNLDTTGAGRAPSPAELRAMTYLALIHGAKGLIYYAYELPSYPGTQEFHLPADAPQLWEAFGPLNHQLQWLAPVILQGERNLLPPAADGALHLGSWQYNGGLYVAAVNTSARTLLSYFELPSAAGKLLQVLFENRQLPSSPDGTFQDSFAPHEVHIYAVQ